MIRKKKDEEINTLKQNNKDENININKNKDLISLGEKKKKGINNN